VPFSAALLVSGHAGRTTAIFDGDAERILEQVTLGDDDRAVLILEREEQLR
jgi:hypothetical protein